MAAAKVLFYVQHLLGIGHLARASRVASALAQDGFAVTMVTGGMPVRGFPGPGMDHVALPAISSASEAFSGLVDAEGTPIDDTFKTQRRDLLLAALRNAKPDIVVLEAFPFGRRQVRFELHAALGGDCGDDATPQAGHLDSRSIAGAGKARPQRRDASNCSIGISISSWSMAIRPLRDWRIRSNSRHRSNRGSAIRVLSPRLLHLCHANDFTF